MNIVICDDQINELENIRHIVSEYAKAHPELLFTVNCFLNPLDMLDNIRKNGVPDIALLDICMPGVLGTEIAKEIQSKGGDNTDIIFLTTSSDFAVEAFALHVNDYLTKPFSVLELAARIRSLLRRSKKDERLIQIHGLCIDLDKRTVTIHEEPVELTFKEFELLKYLAKNEGRAVSREELINQIWGYDFIGESRTLDVHINSLRKKMGNEYAHWIQSVRQVGYRFVAEDNNA